MVSQTGNGEHEKIARSSAMLNLKGHLGGFKEVYGELNVDKNVEIKEMIQDFMFTEGSYLFELKSFKAYKDYKS